MPPMAPPMGMPAKPKTIMPTLAGIFLIIAGLEGMVLWGLVAAAGGVLAGFFVGIPGAEGLAAIIVICGAIGIIFGLIALVGGVMALQRKRWSLALIGSILGLFMLGFVVFEASILSLIAIILLAISRHEF